MIEQFAENHQPENHQDNESKLEQIIINI